MNPPGRCRVNIFGYIPPPCAAPPARRYPTGFAGVFHATVSGLVVGWLAVVEVVDAGVVECVGHTSVRRRGHDCWPWCGSSCWPSSVLMAWASLVFEVVGIVAGRGLGCRVSCPRPLPGVTQPASPECLSPQSRGWLWGCRRVACWWTTSLSIAYSTRVFDVVGVAAGRGVGCPGGRGRCRWGWLFVCSTLWFIRWPGIGSLSWPVRGRSWCQWSGLFVCSTMWVRLLAENWVNSLAACGVDGVFHKHVR